MSFSKRLWQQRQRQAFKSANGYSTYTHYRFGGNRKAVLERDGYRCVDCGMTDGEHREKWGRPITVDHVDRDEDNNQIENLKTRCLRCHGLKDNREQESPIRGHRAWIMALRADGVSCNRIAQQFGVGCRVITKWVKRWNGGVI